MPLAMRYADQDDVLDSLRIKSVDVDRIERVIRMENGLADAFDERCGRSFGVQDAAPVTRVVVAQGGAMLTPQLGIYEVTQIRAQPLGGGEWSVVDPDRWPYELLGEGHDGAYQSVFMRGANWLKGQPVEITGYWSDRNYESVPADVREAMTFITVRQYRRLTASPTEMIGPDGLYVPAPHAWDDPMVKAAIRRHQVHRRRVGV